MVGSRHDSLKIKIATIRRGDRGHSENKTVSWGRLRERLAAPEVDKKYTLPQYLDLSIDKQNRIKDVGSFVGGHFRDGLRKGTSLEQRSIVTLDIDQVAPDQIDLLKMGVSDACRYEFFGSTTRKHTKKKPRWRLVFPLTRPVTIEEYGPLSRILSSTLFHTVAESMDAVDVVSFRHAQIMYWPSVCKDADFEKIHNEGDLLDPDAVLEAFGDWQDWTLLPYSEARGQTRPTTGKKAEDPREKKGLVGAFCRAYDVPAAIETFLPEIYTEGDPNSNKPRYTYAYGSSSNGAVVEDDGLFLYSHHGTDPCADRLVNAFDLVRIHLYGELDLDAPEDARPTELPSYREMINLVRDDAAVQEEFTEDFGSVADIEFEDLGEDPDAEPIRPSKKAKSEKQKPSKRKNETQDDEEDEEEQVEKGKTDGPDMSILKESAFPAPAFPVDALGGFWADRVRLWANDKTAPVDYTAVSLLVGAAALIGNSRKVRPRKGWTEPCILWGALVGSPSMKKSPAMDPVSEAMSEIESEWIAPYRNALREWEADKRRAEGKRKIWEAHIDEMTKAGVSKAAIDEEDLIGGDDSMPEDCVIPKKPVQRRAKVTDSTLEALIYNLEGNPRGLMCLRDELAAWYSSFTRYTGGGGSSDRAVWLEAYGGREYKVDRVKHMDAPVTLPSLAVSVLGGLQPDRLRDFMKISDDGLQARFLYAWPEPIYPQWSPSDLEEDSGALVALQKLADLTMELDDKGRPLPNVLPMTEKASAHFTNWVHQRAVDERLTTGTLSGAFGKADGMVARLALVLEHLWWAADGFSDEAAPEAVSLKAVKAAIRLRDGYFKPMQLRVFNHGASDSSLNQARRLAAWILRERPATVGTRDVTHGSSGTGFGHADAKDVVVAIEALVKAQWLVPIDVETGKRGRPSRRYKIDKRVYEMAED